jgi:hypothetical protein
MLRGRRRLQFSLVTVFVSLTVFGVWLSRQANLARSRIELREAVFEKGGRTEWDMNYQFPHRSFREFLYDDYPVQRIRVPVAFESEFASKVKQLFPEAEFVPLSDAELEALDAEAQRIEEESKKAVSGSTP